MELKDYLKVLRVDILNSGYEKKMSKVGVSPCSSAYAIEIVLSCIKKIWAEDISADNLSERLATALAEKNYYEKMKSINVGKKSAGHALELIIEVARAALTA